MLLYGVLFSTYFEELNTGPFSFFFIHVINTKMMLFGFFSYFCVGEEIDGFRDKGPKP